MMKSKIQKQLQSESGQSVILISAVIASFFMFFGFAINTGILITAKISVQSAADAAAYAGAATQARQLNAISFLNYDMRRQYRKFVYRYSFMGAIASKDFPNLPGGVGGRYGYPKRFFPDSDNTHAYMLPLNVPVVCIPITSTAIQSDNCVTLNLPDTTTQINNFFPQGGLTSVTQQLLSTVNDIQAMQQEQCQKTSANNLFVLIEWLMRGDINPASIAGTLNQMSQSGALSAADQAKLINIISNLVNGLGLYPRNIITLMRIETLAQFLNTPAKKDLQKDAVASLESAPDAEVNERTIQAFKSALANLNNEVLDHNSVIMQELQNDHQITINPVKPSFNAYVQYMQPGGGGGPSGTVCNSMIVPFKARSVPAGVVRAGGPPVHYAVKLTAKAKLLFLPSGTHELELEAFASAKPFGSRIGPANLSEADFVQDVPPPLLGTQVINDCSDSSTKCNVPIVKITAADTSYTQGYLQALGSIGIENNPSGNGKTYTFEGLSNAIFPVPAEVGHYNIIPPPQDATNMGYEFIPYAKDQNSKIFRFYAPIYSGAGNVQAKIGGFLDQVFDTTSVSGQAGQNFSGVDMSTLKSTLLNEMVAYVNGPMASGGAASEHGETTTFAAIELPMAQPPSPRVPVTPQGQHYWLTQSSEVLSSWGPPYGRNSTGISMKPRFGYSVKFVAMQNLLQSGMNESDSDESKISH